MVRFFSSVVMVVFLSGCAVIGPRYSEHQANVPALQDGTSRIVFFLNTRFMSHLADAEIHIYGEKAGDCAQDAYVLKDMPAGHLKIKAEKAFTFESHVVEKDVGSGKEYYYEVMVNDSYIWSGVMLGIIGQAVYTAINDNTGGWIFKEVSKDEAIPQLQDKIFIAEGRYITAAKIGS